MRQRAMIAMAIINDPDVIIADEPTTALDVTVQAQILETLIEVKDAVNAAIVLITHDLGVVAGLADRVLVMYAGRSVELGETRRGLHAARGCRTPPACSARSRPWTAQGGAAAADPGRAAVADQPAAGLPVLAALPAASTTVPDDVEPDAVRDRPARPQRRLPSAGSDLADAGRSRRPSSVPTAVTRVE